MSAPKSSACAASEALLAERASGPLEAAETAALDSHLQGCPRCRAAAERYDTLFSLLSLPPPTLKEEAAMRELPVRALLAYRLKEQRFRRVPALSAVGLLAAAAVLVLLWRVPAPTPMAAGVAAASEAAQPLAMEWTDGPTWEMDEPDATEVASDDGTLLDGLALEGDGAFSLGDSG
jgi:anti-sigma factor RsiW